MDEIFLNFPEAEEGASAADFVPGFVIEGTDPSIPQCLHWGIFPLGKAFLRRVRCKGSLFGSGGAIVNDGDWGAITL